MEGNCGLWSVTFVLPSGSWHQKTHFPDKGTEDGYKLTLVILKGMGMEKRGWQQHPMFKVGDVASMGVISSHGC